MAKVLVCEFSEEELRNIDMALIDRLILARVAMKEGCGGSRLQDNINKYEALRKKVLVLLGESDAKDYS